MGRVHSTGAHRCHRATKSNLLLDSGNCWLCGMSCVGSNAREAPSGQAARPLARPASSRPARPLARPSAAHRVISRRTDSVLWPSRRAAVGSLLKALRGFNGTFCNSRPRPAPLVGSVSSPGAPPQLSPRCPCTAPAAAGGSDCRPRPKQRSVRSAKTWWRRPCTGWHVRCLRATRSDLFSNPGQLKAHML